MGRDNNVAAICQLSNFGLCEPNIYCVNIPNLENTVLKVFFFFNELWNNRRHIEVIIKTKQDILKKTGLTCASTLVGGRRGSRKKGVNGLEDECGGEQQALGQSLGAVV